MSSSLSGRADVLGDLDVDYCICLKISFLTFLISYFVLCFSFQIDLLIPTTIEGIQIYNLPEVRNLQNAVGYDEYIAGSYKFLLQYSTTQSIPKRNAPSKVHTKEHWYNTGRQLSHCYCIPSENVSKVNGKNLLPRRANSLPLEQTPF